ncbi:MAG: sulfotransferase domain-containing protein [Nitrospira sp.]|nr:sulfotransferase domain-containing protein [Nitrospira sp.]
MVEEGRNVKIVRYEDLVEDRRRKLKEIIDYAGLSCSDLLISLVVEKGTFISM